MAVLASSMITLSSVVDVAAVYRYYLLQSSTLAKPSKPTSNPPGSSWDDVEQSYVSGSTNSLYTVDLTVFSDGTWAYSEVSLSSSYEAAKAAYNKAVAAGNAAQDAKDAVDGIEIGGRNLAALSYCGYYSGGTTHSGVWKNVTQDGYSFTTTGNPGDLIGYVGHNLKTGKITISGNTDLTKITPYYRFFDDDGTVIQAQKHLDVTVTDGYFEFPLDVPEGATIIHIGIGLYPYAQDYTVSYVKIENGTKATDWTPAPEDVEAEITNLTEITTTQSTQISTMQGQITALITEDTNIKGDYNALVSRYNATVADVESMKTTIGEHTTLIDANTDDITAVSSRVTTVETDLTGIKTRVSATETAIAKKADGTTVDALTSRVATAESTLEGFETSLTVVEQTVSDNYTELKAYTDTAKASAISTAASDATTKANNAFSYASSLAEMANGELLFKDPTFIDGGNSVYTYNNAGGGDVTVTRIPSPDGCPTASGYCIQVKVTGTTTSPNRGGFYQRFTSRANAHFIIKYLINLPVGYKLMLNTNSLGTGYTDKWLTSADGTGKWQTYIREVKCGSTGSFSTGGYVSVYGGSAPSESDPLIWYLGAIYTYDITQASTVQDQIDLTNATVATHTETISSHDTRITATEEAISLKVSETEFNSYKTTVTGQISTAKSEAISTAASDATTKANSAKSEAISTAASDATTKANSAKSEAISTAASDATTKANNALASAKSYTDAEITVVNESLTTTNQEITVMKGQIALKVEQTDIDTAVTTVKSYADNQIKNNDPVIIGTQTAATGTWTGVAPFASLVDGQRITYWLPYAGSGNATLNLTLSGGGTTGAVNCYYGGTTRLTTHYPAGSSIRLIYRKGVTINGTSYTGWWADANYDSNTYDRTKYNGAVKASAAIVAGNLIVGNSAGYHHLKTGGTFDINYPILYAGSAISSGSTGTNNYIVMPVTITTTQSLTLTAYKALYIKGTLSGSTFTPVSTAPITQTVPTSEDGYYYILLGTAYSTTAFYLLAEHPIYKYVNGAFQQAITQFTSYSTTTQMNSAITAAKNEINLSVSQIYATVDNVSGIESRLSTAESNITAQASSIALCVKESAVTGDYLIGKINLSSTTATIAASHINLAGAVTISMLASDTKTQIDTAATNASTALTNAATAQTTANTASTNATTALGYAQYHYGTCATAAATVAKVVTLNGFKLYTGATVSVKFTYANTAASPTLNVNGTGAKAIYAYGAALTASSPYNWVAGSTVLFTYNGTQWEMTDASLFTSKWRYNQTTNINGGYIQTNTVDAAVLKANTTITNKLYATDLHVSGDSTFEGVLNGATGIFAGSLLAESIEIFSNKTSTNVDDYYARGISVRQILDLDSGSGSTKDGHHELMMDFSPSNGIQMSVDFNNEEDIAAGARFALVQNGIVLMDSFNLDEATGYPIETFFVEASSGDVFTDGNITLDGTVTSNFTNERAFTHTHPTSNVSVSFGVGAGGYNRGVFDRADSTWIINKDQSGGIHINGSGKEYTTLQSSNGWYRSMGYTFRRFVGVTLSSIPAVPSGYRPGGTSYHFVVAQNISGGSYWPAWLSIESSGALTVRTTSSYGATSLYTFSASNVKIWGEVVFSNV